MAINIYQPNLLQTEEIFWSASILCMTRTNLHPFLLAVGIGMPGLAAAGALGGPNSLNPGGHAGPVAPNMGIMAMMSAMPPPSLTAIQGRTADAQS